MFVLRLLMAEMALNGKSRVAQRKTFRCGGYFCRDGSAAGHGER